MKELTLEWVIAFNIIEEIRKSNHKRKMFGEQCIAEDDSKEEILGIMDDYFFRQRKIGIDICSKEFLEMMFPHYFLDIIAAEADFYPNKDVVYF